MSIAPGASGGRPTWTSSAKDMVSSALGIGRVWVTLGFGILNEVYWPDTGSPQIRDLGFIVAGRSGWFEVKRVNQYRISLTEPYIPLPHIVHESKDYRLVLEVIPDPSRDVVLISYRLIGDDLTLYALLAPHIWNSGYNNNAAAGEDLVAWRGQPALCLTSDAGFSRTSAGYVGVSDGWQDFSNNGRMAWTYSEALHGNVALMGELRSQEGTLALGFGGSAAGARTLARSSLTQGFGAIRHRFIEEWRQWGKSLVIPDAPERIRREAYLSAAVLKVHQDRTFPGSVVASLSVPWGNSSDSSGGYHLVWVRDCVESGLALLAAGQIEDAHAMLTYLIATQNADGSWFQNFFPDGKPFWTGVQLDEVGFPITLAAKLAEAGQLSCIEEAGKMMRRAANFIVQNGPISPQDRWEEISGFSPFTLAVEIVALIAAAELFNGEERTYLLSLADYWNERIEDWTYVEGGELAEKYEVRGYYVRVGPSAAEGGLRGRVNVANRLAESLPATAMIGMEFLYLARLGLRDPKDPRILDTLKVAEALLKVETPHGVAYHRYNEDGYGEHPDGSAYDGTGIGRAWPLLTAERAHFDVMLGLDPVRYLEMMTHMTGSAGLIPEQVWDGPALPDHRLSPGKPTGSVMPLVWAHAEFLKLVHARNVKRPLELLNAVEKHVQSRAARARTWHWRMDAPFDALPAGCDLLIDAAAPFLLHMGFDGWHNIEDRMSVPLPLGRHGIRFSAGELAGRGVLDFTLYFVEEKRWEGADHQIALPSKGHVDSPAAPRRSIKKAHARKTKAHMKDTV